jgi:peptide/nickel transport system substrate-binding protein
VLGLAASGLLALGVGGCRPESSEISEFPRTETFIEGGMGWTNPSSFNPLLSSPDWPIGSNLIYETLFDYDTQSGELKPALAKSYSVSQDAVTVELDPAAHWNDGKPVTGCDVSYSFELGRQYRSVPVAPVWQYITRVELPDAPAGTCDQPPAGGRHALGKLRFVLDQTRRNPLVLLDSLAGTRIVPRHKIEPALRSVQGDISKFNQFKFDQDPVGSGPYRLLSYSSEKIVLGRYDDYWGNRARHGGKLPAPKYIIAPIYKSNDHFSIGLQQGRIDIAA